MISKDYVYRQSAKLSPVIQTSGHRISLVLANTSGANKRHETYEWDYCQKNFYIGGQLNNRRFETPPGLETEVGVGGVSFCNYRLLGIMQYPARRS